MNIVSIIISIISLLIALGTFIYNYNVNKMNLKIDLKNKVYRFQKDEDKYILHLYATISNKSRNPINISSVHLKFLKEDIGAFSQPIDLVGNDPKIYGKIIYCKDSSFSIPHTLNSYFSTENPISFVYFTNKLKYKIDVPIQADVIFNTSRGKITKSITITFSEK